MPECTHDCSSCGQSCGERTEPQSLLAKANPNSHVKKVIAVVSGKGGVGKSTVTSILAVNAFRQGKKVGILDADVTGPSIPMAFGLKETAKSDGVSIFPVFSKNEIEVMSLNVLTDDPTTPVMWRGALLNSLIKQFWTDVAWGDLDELYIDMPPGTADIPLTVFQSLPVDAMVVVTAPQDLVSMIVEKALRMAQEVKVPVIGLVENMSYMLCPHCGEKIYPFGSNEATIKEKYGIPSFSALPIQTDLAKLMDAGRIEDYEGNLLLEVSKAVDEYEKK